MADTLIAAASLPARIACPRHPLTVILREGGGSFATPSPEPARMSPAGPPVKPEDDGDDLWRTEPNVPCRQAKGIE